MTSLFRVSLPLALATAAASAVLGTAAAIGIARTGFVGRGAVQGLFLLPVIFPQVLLGVGLFLMYARLETSPTLLSLGLAHAVIATPYVIRVVMSALHLLDPRLEEAAQSLGARPVRAFLLVSLPLLRSSILSGAIFAFIISFSDVNLALFLSAADTTTLPVQILAQMQYSSDPTIAAASAAQVLLISALILVVQRFVGSVRA
nr:ABC transporter permease subunit [Enterovirga sp. DB1703]